MKGILKISLLALSFLFTLIGANAQVNVHGKIKDNTGEVLVGATVIVKGTSQGVITDVDGMYNINNVAEDATLVYTYIGFSTVEEVVGGRTEINVVLEDETTTLAEMVVVGYGSLSKKEISSSIVQVDKSSFNLGAMNNAMELISGKVAGLNVNTTAAANPNSSSSLQVRGATSISASNSPLVVIDGVAGGDIRNIAPQDIETMTVLKDAGSAAIYGTRGANGVILITTKKGTGEVGNVHVTYDSYGALNVAKKAPEVLSANEFRRSRRGNDYGADTDWYDEITRKVAYDMNQYISIDGMGKSGWYTASLNYKDANGLDIVSKRREFGSRFAVEQKAINNRLTLGGSLSARRVNETWGDDGLFDTALSMNPTMPIKNEDGSYYQPSSPTGARNPVSELEQLTNHGRRMYVLGSTEAKLNIINTDKHSLNTSISYSLHYNDLKSDFYAPSTVAESFWNGYAGRASITYQKWYTNRAEWLGNYSLNIDAHNIKLMVGYTYEKSNWEQMFEENRDFAYDKMLYHGIGNGLYLGEGKANMYAGASESALVGFFGRVNYNWQDMLFVSASLRHEGSTKFGKDNKWGNFPAISAAFDMAGLLNMKDVINSMKVRASYGVTGRSDFDAYRSLATYTSSNSYFMDGQWVVGYAPSVNANPNLAWEKSTSANYGVDFELWHRIRGSIEYFDRRSKDLLYNYTAPQPPFVYSTILVNVGTTKNTGIELTLDGDVTTNKDGILWTSGISYSLGQTKLTKLSNDIYQASYIELYQKGGVGTSEYYFRVEEGGKIGQFYGYEYAGVDENGNMLVYTDEGEKVSASKADAKYKKYIGNGAPKHFLSWNNTLRYKNFDLSLNFKGAFGFDIYNTRKYNMGLTGCGSDNVLRSAYLGDKEVKSHGGVISSYFLEKGDYFKLENATLGYNIIPENRDVVDNLRIYVSAKNLFTLTGYEGNDPSIVATTGITPGVDNSSAYPQATQFTLGVTLRFK
ncbi:MAG: SusC/RagA family TonB-linked outer membrane protein [Bacteroidales bacterium]|nr:SusC/RagA family TonB-linked outer membrane protein [Bacteroidales bacterium]